MISFDYHFRVRYKDIDQMGVMYYSRYFEYYEAARTDLMHDLGLSYKTLEEQGIMMPVVHSESDYLGGPGFDDELIIRTQITKKQSSRMEIDYAVIRIRDAKLLNRGKTIHAFVNRRGKPVRMPENLKSLIEEKWKASHE